MVLTNPLLRSLDHPVLGLLYEGKLVVDKTYGHASYGCTHCCGFSSSPVSPTPFSGPPGMDNPDTYQAYSVCMSAWDDFDFATNWQSSRTSVATLPTSMLHTVAPGTATGSARNTLAYQQYPGYPCPNEPMVGNQPVTVQPQITSLDPNPIMIRVSNTTLTINGSGFGTNPTVNLPSGITSTGQGLTDTQIVLTGVAVAFSAKIGLNNVTVAASGVTSSPASLTINGPNQMVVQSDTIAPCIGYGGQCRIVSYIVKNYDGSLAARIPIAENISFSGWNCQQTAPNPTAQQCDGQATTDASGSMTDEWSMLTGDTPAGCGWNITDHWQWCGPTGNNPNPGITFGTLVGWAHTASVNINGYTNPPTPIPPGTVFSP